MPVRAVELNGLYRWGGAQALTLKTHQGRVEAFLSAPGGCGLDPSRPVLKGDWEGDVLVGEVTLCQVGAGCGPAQYAFLGFYNASDGSLTADLELETSCEIPALKDGRLVLDPLPRGGGSESSAALIAVAAETVKLGPHTARGQQLLHEDDVAGAVREFQRAIERREDASRAYAGLGLVEANQQHWAKAVRFYRHALDVRPDPLVYYNLACAYSRLSDRRNALANLRLAIQSGFTRDEDLAKDPDLLPLLGTDPEFHALLAKLQAHNANTDATGAGHLR